MRVKKYKVQRHNVFFFKTKTDNSAPLCMGVLGIVHCLLATFLFTFSLVLEIFILNWTKYFQSHQLHHTSSFRNVDVTLQYHQCGHVGNCRFWFAGTLAKQTMAKHKLLKSLACKASLFIFQVVKKAWLPKVRGNIVGRNHTFGTRIFCLELYSLLRHRMEECGQFLHFRRWGRNNWTFPNHNVGKFRQWNQFTVGGIHNFHDIVDMIKQYGQGGYCLVWTESPKPNFNLNKHAVRMGRGIWVVQTKLNFIKKQFAVAKSPSVLICYLEGECICVGIMDVCWEVVGVGWQCGSW